MRQRSRRGRGSMSLQGWQWEDEDRTSLGRISSINSFFQSASEYDTEEHLESATQARESDTDFECCSLESLEEPATSSYKADMPQVVPCKFIISLAFPANLGHKGKYSSFPREIQETP
nr:uncharacterized protein KIAA1257-like [Microcebus murinus]